MNESGYTNAMGACTSPVGSMAPRRRNSASFRTESLVSARSRPRMTDSVNRRSVTLPLGPGNLGWGLRCTSPAYRTR
jgi:hypothetical protein